MAVDPAAAGSVTVARTLGGTETSRSKVRASACQATRTGPRMDRHSARTSVSPPPGTGRISTRRQPGSSSHGLMPATVRQTHSPTEPMA